MKKQNVLVVSLVGLVAVGAGLFFGLSRNPAEPATDALEQANARIPADEGQGEIRRSADAAKGGSADVKAGKKRPMAVHDDDDDARRTPEERRLAADIEKSLDEEDFALAKKCAPLALESKDAAIRQSMVDTLGWFGEKAIPELTPFLADPDEDVAESAMNEWETAVSSIEDEKLKIGVVEMAMQVISNEDGIESIANEYIGVDEKLAVESLTRVIEGGGNAKGIARAKETYEFVTGDAYTSRAAAEKWIAEEYQP